MILFTSKNLFLALLLLSVVVFGIACSAKTQLNEMSLDAQETPKQVKEVVPCATEPNYGFFPNAPAYKNLEAAWKQFIASGQYRLACDSDADFALEAVESKMAESYRKNYQQRSIANFENLVVIVIDTTRTGSNRFGLVIFSPSQKKKNAYDVNWLYQNRDLSRASVGMSSGQEWVEDYTTDGKRSQCWIVWNKNKIFECKEISS